MKRLRLTQDHAALAALAGIGLGVALVASLGWALIVVSALVLVYVILPDQSGGPTQ